MIRITSTKRELRASLLGALVTVALFVPSRASAETPDSARARELLVAGYSLAREGKCAEAIPRFLESHGLEPQVKVLFNLARCEEDLGRLADALRHWTDARELADAEHLAGASAEAERRRARLETQVPRLTIRLAEGAPPATAVTCDARELTADALARPLLLDSGAHTLVASAPGRADGSLRIELQTGERTTVVVQPGPALATAPSPTVAVDAAPRALPAAPDAAPSPLRAVGAVAAGVGIVGLGVGAYFGIRALEKNAESNEVCRGDRCPPQGVIARNDAVQLAHTSTALLVGGAVVTATGIALFVLAPKSGDRAPGVSGTHVAVAPIVHPWGGGLSLGGSF